MSQSDGNQRDSRGSGARLLAESGWSGVLDRLLAGILHDINGRITSLSAVAQLIGLGEPLPGTLSIETEKLGEVAEALSLLLGNPNEDPIPLRPAELVRGANRIQHHLREPSQDSGEARLLEGDGVPPVLVNPVRVVRGLVILSERLTLPTSGQLGWELTGHPDGAQLLATGASLPATDETEALTRLFHLDGIALAEADRGVTLDFPSLAQARAAGR